MRFETCGNCGRMIGHSQTPCVWGEKVVCELCHKALSKRCAQGATPEPSPHAPLVAVQPKSGGGTALLLGACVVTLVLGLALSYLVAVKPLQDRLVKTREELNDLAALTDRQAAALDSLVKTVSRNAEVAGLAADKLESLTQTVNHNAEAANRTADALVSLTRTVNHNADVANFNNNR